MLVQDIATDQRKYAKRCIEKAHHVSMQVLWECCHVSVNVCYV